MRMAGNRNIVSRNLPWLLFLAVGFGEFSCAGNAFGQAADDQTRYLRLPPELDSREASKLKPAVTQALRNPAGFGADKQAVEDYLTKYFFRAMTLYDADSLSDLAKNRERLFKSFIGGTANSNSQQELIVLTLKVAKVLTQGNFHPAVRYNAVLMLGELDRQLATNTTPPVPLPDATAALLEVIEQDTFGKDEVPVPESVKLGALIGLERHTRYGIDPQYADRLTQDMLKVIADREAPEDIDQDVHDWLRGTAARVLVNHYAKNPTPAIQAALTAMIADDKMGLDDRCLVVGSLSNVAYPKSGDVGGNAEVQAVGHLTLDVIAEGAELARDYQTEILGGGFAMPTPRGRGRSYGGYREYGGGYGGEFGGRGGFRGGGMGPGADTGPKFERRQLVDRLTRIVEGSKSLVAGMSDSHKDQLDALLNEIAPAMEVLEDKDSVEVTVTDAVIALEQRVQALVNGWQSPEPAAAEEDEAAAAGFGG